MNSAELNLLHAGYDGARLTLIAASLSAPLSGHARQAFPYI